MADVWNSDKNLTNLLSLLWLHVVHSLVSSYLGVQTSPSQQGFVIHVINHAQGTSWPEGIFPAQTPILSLARLFLYQYSHQNEQSNLNKNTKY